MALSVKPAQRLIGTHNPQSEDFQDLIFKETAVVQALGKNTSNLWSKKLSWTK